MKIFLTFLLSIACPAVPQAATAELHASFVVNQNNLKLSTPEDFKVELDSVPCNNQDRLDAAKASFEKVGASTSDITVDKYKDVENLIVRKQGTSQEMIIIGGHYDKVSPGCGAIDNWTGVVTLAPHI